MERVAYAAIIDEALAGRLEKGALGEESLMRSEQSLTLALADNEVDNGTGEIFHEADARRDRIVAVSKGQLAPLGQILLRLGGGAILGHLDVAGRVGRSLVDVDGGFGMILSHGDWWALFRRGKRVRRRDGENERVNECWERASPGNRQLCARLDR